MVHKRSSRWKRTLLVVTFVCLIWSVPQAQAQYFTNAAFNAYASDYYSSWTAYYGEYSLYYNSYDMLDSGYSNLGLAYLWSTYATDYAYDAWYYAWYGDYYYGYWNAYADGARENAYWDYVYKIDVEYYLGLTYQYFWSGSDYTPEAIESGVDANYYNSLSLYYNGLASVYGSY